MIFSLEVQYKGLRSFPLLRILLFIYFDDVLLMAITKYYDIFALQRFYTLNACIAHAYHFVFVDIPLMIILHEKKLHIVYLIHNFVL